MAECLLVGGHFDATEESSRMDGWMYIRREEEGVLYEFLLWAKAKCGGPYDSGS